MTKVLFVCLGNICRSPTAEVVFQARAARAGLAVSVASAGTGAWHVGKPPDARAQKVAKARGYDLSGQRAAQVRAVDFDRFDFILAMDLDNLAQLNAMAPPGSRAETCLFLSYASGLDVEEVPDPYYGEGDEGFHEVLDMIEQAADGLVAALRGCGA